MSAHARQVTCRKRILTPNGSERSAPEALVASNKSWFGIRH